MRRRRFPRRPIRPRPGMAAARRRPLIPPKLVEAHRLFDQGEYQKASQLYIELAEKAEVRGIQQAPNLYLRGATAWLKSGDPEKSVDMIKRGLGVLVARQKWLQLKKMGGMTVERLKSEGQDELAAEITTWLEEQVPDEIKTSETWQRAASAGRPGSQKLPSTCGQCGGPVNPREVEWFDARNPVCSYCGAILETDL